MQALLWMDLSDEPNFGQPVLAWARQHFPNLAVFDLDTRSEEMLQHYAVRLLQETPGTIVCLKAGEGNLNQLMPLLEELLQPQPQRHLLLLGHHPRLSRMLHARPTIRHSAVADEEELKRLLLQLIPA